MAKNTNAKQEFLNHTSGKEVLCAQIQRGDWGDDEEIALRTFILTTGWTKEDWNYFLSELDFDYDSGYGSQELFGTIWYKDGTWSDRREYDGSECWKYQSCPEIPQNLKRIEKEREQKLNKIMEKDDELEFSDNMLKMISDLLEKTSIVEDDYNNQIIDKLEFSKLIYEYLDLVDLYFDKISDFVSYYGESDLSNHLYSEMYVLERHLNNISKLADPRLEDVNITSNSNKPKPKKAATKKPLKK